MKRASSSVGLIWLDCLGQVMTARQVRDLLNKVFWEVKQPERASSTLQIPRIDLSLCIHASEILVGQANQHPWSTESEPMHGQRHMRAHWKEKEWSLNPCPHTNLSGTNGCLSGLRYLNTISDQSLAKC